MYSDWARLPRHQSPVEIQRKMVVFEKVGRTGVGAAAAERRSSVVGLLPSAERAGGSGRSAEGGGGV